MKIVDLGNGKIKLIPDAGKTLYCSLDKQEHSEAIIDSKYIKYFTEI